MNFRYINKKPDFGLSLRIYFSPYDEEGIGQNIWSIELLIGFWAFEWWHEYYDD